MIKEVIEIVTDVLSIIKHLFSLKRADKELQKVKLIYQEMTNIVETTPVERFLLLKAENGGGVVKPGVHLYASVIYEMYRHPIKSHIAIYQRILLDSGYINYLVQAIQSDYVDILPEKMEDSILKQIYEAEDLKFSKMFYLGSTKKSIYYCTLATADAGEYFQRPQDRLAISLAINKIKTLLK